VLIDLARVITFEENADHVRVTIAAGNGVLTFMISETMAAVIQAIAGGGEE